MRFPAPAPPYLGPAAHTSAGANKPIRRIVIHSTVSPCKRGQARETAAYFRSEKSGGSAHYVVDPGEVVQVVFDGVVAWHAPPNPNSLGVEMCEFPSMDIRRWADGAHSELLSRTAHLVAKLCVAYNVPTWYIGRLGLLAGRRGVTTHADVAKAFRQSTHWDPGAWPRKAFMRQVRAEAKRIRKGK